MNYKKAFLALGFCLFAASSSYAMKCPKGLALNLITLGAMAGDNLGISNKAISLALSFKKKNPEQFESMVKFCEEATDFGIVDVDEKNKIIKGLVWLDGNNINPKVIFDNAKELRAAIRLISILGNQDCKNCKKNNEDEIYKDLPGIEDFDCNFKDEGDI